MEASLAKPQAKQVAAGDAMEVNSSEVSTEVESFENLEYEEDEVFFQDIDLLAEHGVREDDIKSIKNMGINTIKGLQMTMRKKLLEIKGITEEKIDKIKEACCKISLSNVFMTALEVSDQRKQVFKLHTGSSHLDKLLGGGIESMSITEVFGEFRTGKTQLSHTLCVTAQMPGANGYLGGKVMFIDTEHTFRPERLRPIAERFNLDQTAVMENILYARAYNSEHQFEILNLVAAKFHEESGIFKLLIVDSIMALFRVDYSGRGEIADRQQKLGQMLSRLQKISEEFNVAVFITNQIASDFSAAQLEPDLPKPVGGNVLAHASTTRLALRKGKGNRRIARLYDSPDLEENEVSYIITNGGIDDPKTME
ncbi:meiotic recombination protein DMC1/LIM15 homolog [Diabrotica virgifera virgifera]|uniref:Meiotic recombination protein DMC1/LIM15 homolog n=1 Tax=Diabrotica virgifera virgifera TaxID=50390 RepID=A0ABM5JXB1_DIAVI|nr:meiotic recombination protein DMC1/LIM15 homolog [Diabrotica virgifera virgifera]